MGGPQTEFDGPGVASDGAGPAFGAGAMERRATFGSSDRFPIRPS
jgi:hypothetical protein